MLHTYKIAFEDCDAVDGDLLDGFATIEACRDGWDIVGIEVFGGRNGAIVIDLAQTPAAENIIAYLMARPSWVKLADDEHGAYFPAPPRRNRLAPAYVE